MIGNETEQGELSWPARFNSQPTLLEAIRSMLQESGRVLIVAHIRPDGDAIGSLLGLGLALQAAGKQVELVSADGVPENFRFLPGAEQIVVRPRGNYDRVITVDCSDLKRAGKALDGVGKPDLNIDHHITNENFARLNLVDRQAVATSEILAVLLPVSGISLTKPAAAGLLTGIVADTLGFRTPNTSANTLRVAADLMEFGLDLAEIYQKTLIRRSFEAVRYWAAGLNQIQRAAGLVWTSLTLQDRKAVQYPGRDDADLINVLSAIDQTEVAIVFVEQSPKRVKVSWRARPGLDVAQVAASFGGGGHPAAAGAEIQGCLPEVQALVLNETQRMLVASASGQVDQKVVNQ